MTSKSKAKGNTFERELVQEFQSYGFEAKRAWGSNGNSLGEHEEVDVVVHYEAERRGRQTILLQAKRRKKLPAFLGLTDKVDASVFREDNGKAFILMPLNKFIQRFLSTNREMS